MKKLQISITLKSYIIREDFYHYRARISGYNEITSKSLRFYLVNGRKILWSQPLSFSFSSSSLSLSFSLPTKKGGALVVKGEGV